MKALLLSGLMIVASGLFMSAGRSNSHDLSRDQTFVKSVQSITALASNIDILNESQLNLEMDKLANSIDKLKKKYPELSNITTSANAINVAIEGSVMHPDACFKALIRDVYTCLANCGGPRETVRACLATACANYQACKAGENR